MKVLAETLRAASLLPHGVPRRHLQCQLSAACRGRTSRGRAVRLTARETSAPRCRRCRHIVSASFESSYTPYPFTEADYYQVGLQMVQKSGFSGVGPQQGYFLLMRVTKQDLVEDSERGLIMSVGGDTLESVAQLAAGLPTGARGGRPLSLDLLWQVLERGQEISKRTWAVLRVAVVELRGQTFVGRVFFGDPASGQVAWDCDCRPSDACWLALKSKAPIWVHQTIWEDCAVLLRDVQRGAEDRQAESVFAELSQVPTPTAIMTTPRPADPEPLKRLKMEMRVALKDEDYAAAARIRDHPFMRLHCSSLQAAQDGDEERAAQYEAQLAEAIRQHELEERQGALAAAQREGSAQAAP
ncbi:hypothetical protein D9Q98_005647 [Chlorella vulgaris]|uniref:BFN domain-containing protein n=1 Tax=Chlorella vulgaris TaxID=3077 RepID=A0A9D4TM88_CHLVU|nr:hypothetical protein D9Q98_005647 [Chlorella vulgaris]